MTKANAAEKPPEKMQTVINALTDNPDVVVVGGYQRTSSDYRGVPQTWWAHALHLFVHPAVPLYDAAQLNEFTASLAPKWEVSVNQSAYEFNGDLTLGFLRFDEHIGQITTAHAAEIDSESLAVRSGLLASDPKSTITTDLHQLTYVRVYPDLGHVADMACGLKCMGHVPTTELGTSTNTNVENLLHAPALGHPRDPEVEEFWRIQEMREQRLLSGPIILPGSGRMVM